MKKELLASPMLADGNTTFADVKRLVQDDSWATEQKLDGMRMRLTIVKGQASLVSRTGNVSSVPKLMVPELKGAFTGTWQFDGELLADGSYWVFDCCWANDQDIRGAELLDRRMVLHSLFDLWVERSVIQLLPQAIGEVNKARLVKAAFDNNSEGVVFKALGAPYLNKRTTSMRKCKFTSTVDAIVVEVGRKGKEAIGLGLIDVPYIGAVSTHLKVQPQLGDVVEVRYLYTSRDNRLVQPRLLGIRTDKKPEECTSEQLAGTVTNKTVLTL